MNNKLEQLNSELNEKATAHAAKAKKCKEDLNTSRAELERLTAQLEEVQELEEYEKTRAAIVEAKAKIEFCEKALRQTKEKIISDKEYSDISAQVNEEVHRIQAKHAPKIQKTLAELIGLLNNYCDEVAEVETIKNAAAKLNVVSGSLIAPPPSERGTLATFSPDALEYQPEMLRAYFNHKNMVDTAQANPDKIIKNEFNNPELRRIALAIAKGRR